MNIEIKSLELQVEKRMKEIKYLADKIINLEPNTEHLLNYYVNCLKNDTDNLALLRQEIKILKKLTNF